MVLVFPHFLLLTHVIIFRLYRISFTEDGFVLKLHFTWFRCILLDFSLTVKAATLIFISGCGSAISSAKEGNSGSIYNLEKS